VKKPCFVKFPKENASRSNDFSFEEEVFANRMGTDFLERLDQVLSTGDFQRQKIGLIEKREGRPVDSPDGLDGWDSTRSDFLRQNQFSKGSGTKEIDITSEGSEYSSMRILADDHPFSTIDGNRGVGGSTAEISSVLEMCFEKGWYILDPLLKKGLSVLFSEKQEGPVFLNERKRGGDGDISKHFSFRIK